MSEFRITNPAGHLVCVCDEASRTVSIKHKDYMTTIRVNADGTFATVHKKLPKQS